MSSHPTHKLTDYAQGALPAAEHAVVQSHLGVCETCQAAVTSQRVLLRAFAGRPPDVESPLEIQGILARAAAGEAPAAAPLKQAARVQVALGVLAGALAGMLPFVLPQGLSCTPGRYAVQGQVMVAGQAHHGSCVLEGVQLGVVDAMPVRLALKAADVVLSPGSRARVGEDGRALEVQQGTVWLDGSGVRVDTVVATITLLEPGALEVAVGENGNLVDVKVRAGRARLVRPDGSSKELGSGEDAEVRAPRIAAL